MSDQQRHTADETTTLTYEEGPCGRIKRERDEAKEAYERYESLWREAEEAGAATARERDACKAQVDALREALEEVEARLADMRDDEDVIAVIHRALGVGEDE